MTDHLCKMSQIRVRNSLRNLGLSPTLSDRLISEDLKYVVEMSETTIVYALGSPMFLRDTPHVVRLTLPKIELRLHGTGRG